MSQDGAHNHLIMIPLKCLVLDLIVSIGHIVQLYFPSRVLPRALRRKALPPEHPRVESFVPGMQSVYVKTWGCSHNSSDGEYMAGLLATSGYTITGGWAPTGAGP